MDEVANLMRSINKLIVLFPVWEMSGIGLDSFTLLLHFIGIMDIGGRQCPDLIFLPCGKFILI